MGRRKSEDILGNLDERDIVQGGQMLSGFALPGKAAAVAGAGLEYLDSDIEIDRKKRDYQRIGMNLDDAKKFSSTARKELEKLEAKPTSKFIKYAVQAVGGLGAGFLGSMIGTAVLPFGGTLIGGGIASMIGWNLTGKVYDGFVDKSEQDGVALAAGCFCKHRDGGHISEMEAFASLMAVLPDRAQKRYEDMLERATGERRFDLALQTPKGQRALQRIMANPEIDDVLRAHFGIPFNPSQPDKKVWRQYAEMINAGIVDPRDIVLDRGRMQASMTRYGMAQSMPGEAAPDELVVSPQVPGRTASLGRSLD